MRSAEKARVLYGDGSGVAIAEADYSDSDALDAVLCQHPACRLFIACANGPQLQLHFHRLYYERFYSTQEHCRYRYVLPAPG